MERIYIGKIVNTHGIKGELRIKSVFDKKELAFVKGNKLIISGVLYEIKSYRVHKDYDMVSFIGYENINLVLDLKGKSVFIDKDELKLDENDIIYNDYINSEVILDGEKIGVVIDYTNDVNPLLIVKGSSSFYIPLKANFISFFDKNAKRIVLDESARGLL